MDSNPHAHAPAGRYRYAGANRDPNTTRIRRRLYNRRWFEQHLHAHPADSHGYPNAGSTDCDADHHSDSDLDADSDQDAGTSAEHADTAATRILR
jgi:hypothetical protein